MQTHRTRYFIWVFTVCKSACIEGFQPTKGFVLKRGNGLLFSIRVTGRIFILFQLQVYLHGNLIDKVNCADPDEMPLIITYCGFHLGLHYLLTHH